MNLTKFGRHLPRNKMSQTFESGRPILVPIYLREFILPEDQILFFATQFFLDQLSSIFMAFTNLFCCTLKKIVPTICNFFLTNVANANYLRYIVFGVIDGINKPQLFLIRNLSKQFQRWNRFQTRIQKFAPFNKCKLQTLLENSGVSMIIMCTWTSIVSIYILALTPLKYRCTCLQKIK